MGLNERLVLKPVRVVSSEGDSSGAQCPVRSASPAPSHTALRRTLPAGCEPLFPPAPRLLFCPRKRRTHPKTWRGRRSEKNNPQPKTTPALRNEWHCCKGFWDTFSTRTIAITTVWTEISRSPRVKLYNVPKGRLKPFPFAASYVGESCIRVCGCHGDEYKENINIV